MTTVAASPTPRKISAGVISAPPPMPVSPTTTPTRKPAARIEKKVTVMTSAMGTFRGGVLGKPRKSTDARRLREAVARRCSPAGQAVGTGCRGLAAASVRVHDVMGGRAGRGGDQVAPVSAALRQLRELRQREDAERPVLSAVSTRSACSRRRRWPGGCGSPRGGAPQAQLAAIVGSIGSSRMPMVPALANPARSGRARWRASSSMYGERQMLAVQTNRTLRAGPWCSVM